MKGEEWKHNSENVIEEQRQILPSQKNKLYLGNVRLLAPRNFTKPLLFPDFQDAQPH